VPNRILIVVFPELKLYGFRPGKRPFPELLRILEEDGAPGLGGATMQERKPIVIAIGSTVAIEIGSLF
jgi:predicted amidohydrolase